MVYDEILDYVESIDPTLEKPSLLNRTDSWFTCYVFRDSKPAILKVSRRGFPLVSMELSRLEDAEGSGVTPELLDVYSLEGDNVAFLRSYVEGDLLTTSALRNPEIFNSTLKVCDVLHERGIVGLDVKLDNFVISNDGVKIVDLGVPSRHSCPLLVDSQKDVDKIFGLAMSKYSGDVEDLVPIYKSLEL